ncbi:MULTISPECIES: hypothetical protein [unclassified Duganella]|uniref:hypothetical protein n=1 Tax=unclassified Duganella TaxID=2636909 RepID=UPI0008882D68|nr:MULTISPECIES: hypothetical protein [unclassified Duganella]SDF58653.1 TolB amino-terminal domain-containing protein [Duganella sp. OV458]SDI69947.1 TolB amino-terminal domain-containing protein [Duganella sp. OV510]
MLASPEFAKAPRLRRLLAFLVEKRMDGALRDLNEYTIGIEVFERTASSFHTGEDPVVRVQMGRLRDKLAAYYLGSGRHAPHALVIPKGSYVPLLHNAGLPTPRPLALAPLRCLAQDAPASVFVQGLNEELIDHLFRRFGAAPGLPQARQALEGSVRADAGHLRVSVRLRDTASGNLLWSAQFDHQQAMSIALQASLAAEIGTALQSYFILNGNE